MNRRWGASRSVESKNKLSFSVQKITLYGLTIKKKYIKRGDFLGEQYGGKIICYRLVTKIQQNLYNKFKFVRKKLKKLGDFRRNRQKSAFFKRILEYLGGFPKI